jgi:hypothetical protein
MTDLRFPIGPFAYHPPASAEERLSRIDQIAATPDRVRAAVSGLTRPQLDTPYRPGGWSVRQVVHHLVDSHLNAYLRCKLALTEDHPTIKPYDQARWAEGPEYQADVAPSLDLLTLLHGRWVLLLWSLAPEAFGRTFFHPEGRETFTLDRVVAMYAWHGAHHVAHITELRRRQGW